MDLHNPHVIQGRSGPVEMEHVWTSAEDAIGQNTTVQMEQMNSIVVLIVHCFNIFKHC